MKTIAMIPARYQASRFPGKLLAKIGTQSVILRTYLAVKNTELFDDVYVVTDHDDIESEIVAAGGKVIRSEEEYECGTDRIAAASENIDADIIINVQGDEPFMEKEPLRLMIQEFKNDTASKIDLISLMQPLTDWELIEDPSFVKVIVDEENFALYFSRSPIPYPRDKSKAKFNHHIGVYGFRKKTLIDFYNLPMGKLEEAEKIECIRYLEFGRNIKMIPTQYSGLKVDTPEDLKRAIDYYNSTTI